MRQALFIVAVGVAGADVLYRQFVRPGLRKAIGWEPLPGERELERAILEWIS